MHQESVLDYTTTLPLIPKAPEGTDESGQSSDGGNREESDERDVNQYARSHNDIKHASRRGNDGRVERRSASEDQELDGQAGASDGGLGEVKSDTSDVNGARERADADSSSPSSIPANGEDATNAKPDRADNRMAPDDLEAIQTFGSYSRDAILKMFSLSRKKAHVSLISRASMAVASV